jgi:hypothetical protein
LQLAAGIWSITRDSLQIVKEYIIAANQGFQFVICQSPDASDQQPDTVAMLEEKLTFWVEKYTI